MLEKTRWVLGTLLLSCFWANVANSQEPKRILEEFIFESAPFPSCHASSIVQCRDGTLVCAWFGGLHEKADDVGIWLSRRVGDRWTAPVEVANGVQFGWESASASGRAVQRYPTWNPVLFLPSRGPLQLYFKIGPSPQTWWGMRMESDDNALTWASPVRLPEGILGPIKNKPIELSDGSILCPSSNETPDEKDEWSIHMERVSNQERTWTRTKPLNDPSQFGLIQPSLLKLGDGHLMAVGRSRQGRIFEIESKDEGKTWGSPSLTNLPNPNSGTDAVTLQDGRHLLIYNHVTKESSEWGGHRSPLNVAISSDGHDWKPILELENEPKQEFSYPAVIQSDDGKVHVTYTWKRKRIKHVVLELVEK